MRVPRLLVVPGILLCAEATNPRVGTNGFLIQNMIYTSGFPGGGSGGGGGSSGGGGQQIALASYIDPLGDPAAWSRMVGYPTSKLSVLVANVANGPDSVTNSNWQRVIQAATLTGKTVIGYVRTGYFGLNTDHYTTRLNSVKLSDWVAQIEEDVDMWYNLYPGMMGGIFFDEGWNDCGPNNIYSDLYQHITSQTKRKHPGAFTVINPGTSIPQCYEHSADTLLTSETTYDTYLNAYAPLTWTPSDPRKIWHIIYATPDGQEGAVAALAKQRNAGIIEITDGSGKNPYNTLPSDSYMQAVFNAIPGGSPLHDGLTSGSGGGGGAATGPPADLAIQKFEYSSVTLQWTPGPQDAAYRVYTTNVDSPNGPPFPSLDLPASMSDVTVGGLQPGTRAYQFQVCAVGEDGKESLMHPIQSGTLALPVAHQPIKNVTASPSAGSTTFKADILVPFGFIRVYVWVDDDKCTKPGWPINYSQQHYLCTQYMVESDVLYSYSGSNFTWAWTKMGDAPHKQNGYTVTWNVPLGTSTVDTTKFIIQAQGYNPLTNVFSPCGAIGSEVALAGAHCEN